MVSIGDDWMSLGGPEVKTSLGGPPIDDITARALINLDQLDECLKTLC